MVESAHTVQRCVEHAVIDQKKELEARLVICDNDSEVNWKVRGL